MKKYKYKINEKIICIDNISRSTYGVDIFDITCKNELLVKIYDISPNKQMVEYLVCRCNLLNVSPIHIFDVIEDIL